MKIKFKPSPRPLFNAFDGFDAAAYAEVKAAEKCARGSRRNKKTGKCEPKRSTRKAGK